MTMEFGLLEGVAETGRAIDGDKPIGIKDIRIKEPR